VETKTPRVSRSQRFEVDLPVAEKSRLSLVRGAGRNGKFLTQKGDGLLKGLQPACGRQAEPFISKLLSFENEIRCHSM
jgi:hypothetical protein